MILWLFICIFMVHRGMFTIISYDFASISLHVWCKLCNALQWVAFMRAINVILSSNA